MIRKLFLVVTSLLALVVFSPAQAGEVARAILTTGIVEREPVNQLDAIPADAQRAIFFTDIRDMKGKAVTHTWKHNGEVMAEVKFNVGGPRWRVWSSKNLMPEWGGEWSVTVTDEWGNKLAEKQFTYEATAMTDEGMDEMTGDAVPSEEGDKPAQEQSGEMDADKPMDESSGDMGGEKATDAPAEEPMKAAE